MPVCGVDGYTYNSLCSLNCEGIEKAHDGHCKKKPMKCACAMVRHINK